MTPARFLSAAEVPVGQVVHAATKAPGFFEVERTACVRACDRFLRLRPSQKLAAQVAAHEPLVPMWEAADAPKRS